jgi:Flp pilus assembly protein TadG
MLSPGQDASKQQRGFAIVEFLIILPLLLLLLLGTAEFGRTLYQYNTLTKAVRDGARYLATNAPLGSTNSIVIDATDQAETENLVVYGNSLGAGAPLLPGLTTADVTVGCMGGGMSCTGVEHIVVTARYAYQPMIGVALPAFGLGSDISLNYTLSSTVTMRVM